MTGDYNMMVLCVILISRLWAAILLLVAQIYEKVLNKGV